MKPGYRTTEFWLSAVMSLTSILGTAGVIGPSDLPTLGEAAKSVVLGIVGVATIVSYIASRTKLKDLD